MIISFVLLLQLVASFPATLFLWSWYVLLKKHTPSTHLCIGVEGSCLRANGVLYGACRYLREMAGGSYGR